MMNLIRVFLLERAFLMEEVKTLASMAGKNKNFVATVDKEGHLRPEPSTEDYTTTTRIPIHSHKIPSGHTTKVGPSDRHRGTRVSPIFRQLELELSTEKETRQKLQSEIKRLRQQLVYSEERRKSDLHRQMQIVRGKEQESEYIWQKYVEAVRDSTRQS